MNKAANGEMNSLILGASLVSIATSIYIFAKGSREAGIFVGLWAPTFLGLGSFYQANRVASASAE